MRLKHALVGAMALALLPALAGAQTQPPSSVTRSGELYPTSPGVESLVFPDPTTGLARTARPGDGFPVNCVTGCSGGAGGSSGTVYGPDAVAASPTQPPIQAGYLDAAGKVARVQRSAGSGVPADILSLPPVTDTNSAANLAANQTTAAGIGTPADAPATTGGASGTALAELKGILNKLIAGLPVTDTNGAANLAATQSPSGWATAQGSATTTSGSTALIAARTLRRSVTVENVSTTPCYLGPTGVSSTTGMLLPGVVGSSITITFTGAVYAVTASGTAALQWNEVF